MMRTKHSKKWRISYVLTDTPRLDENESFFNKKEMRHCVDSTYLGAAMRMSKVKIEEVKDAKGDF